MSEGLNAVNFGQTTLNGALLAGANSAIFTTVSNMPAVPFLFQIDGEIFKATALNGSTYTIVGGQEGTTPAAHANDVQISIVLTAEMYLACAPNGSEVSQPGGTLQMGKYDFIFAVDASAAGSIAPPVSPVPLARYTIVDVGNNFGSNNQNFNSGQATLGAGNQNGSSYTFTYLPTAAEWIAVL